MVHHIHRLVKAAHLLDPNLQREKIEEILEDNPTRKDLYEVALHLIHGNSSGYLLEPARIRLIDDFIMNFNKFIRKKDSESLRLGLELLLSENRIRATGVKRILSLLTPSFIRRHKKIATYVLEYLLDNLTDDEEFNFVVGSKLEEIRRNRKDYPEDVVNLALSKYIEFWGIDKNLR